MCVACLLPVVVGGGGAGAARVAMGLEVPAFFSNKKSLGRWLQDQSWAIEDPVWQLPLYQGYRKHLKSNLADMRNTGAGGR